MDEFEVRTFGLTEIRVAEDDDGFDIRGVAAVYDKPTDMGWYKEKVAQGTFADTISADDIRSCFNHDMNLILGRNRSGTLRIEDRDDGLHFSVKSPKTSYAEDLKESVKRGDVDGCSFMFITQEDSWDQTDPKMPIRTLQKCKLFELGPVTIPAYPQTSVYARGMGVMAQLRDTSLPINEETRAMIERLEQFLNRSDDPSISQVADDDENVNRRVQVDIAWLRAKIQIARARC
jgi:hypothetical protein